MNYGVIFNDIFRTFETLHFWITGRICKQISRFLEASFSLPYLISLVKTNFQSDIGTKRHPNEYYLRLRGECQLTSNSFEFFEVPQGTAAVEGLCVP